MTPPAVGEFRVKLTGLPVHIEAVELVIENVGLGFTVMVNVWAVPAQLPWYGVTVSVATTGLLPVLIPVNELMLPLPPEGNPIPGVSLLQT
jgi:hypothetical protein